MPWDTGNKPGQRRHSLTLYQVQRWGIWGTQGPGIYQTLFLVPPPSPALLTKAPLTQHPPPPPPSSSRLPTCLEKAHRASCGYDCPVRRQAVGLIFTCTCFRHSAPVRTTACSGSNSWVEPIVWFCCCFSVIISFSLTFLTLFFVLLEQWFSKWGAGPS